MEQPNNTHNRAMVEFKMNLVPSELFDAAIVIGTVCLGD